MLPQRRSGEQNQYYDKPPDMLREHYADLETQSQQAYDFYLSLEAAKLAVLQAIEENTANGVIGN